MKELKVGQKVLVNDEVNFYNAVGTIMSKITDTRYSVKVSTSKTGTKNKTFIRMRFNIDQLTKK